MSLDHFTVLREDGGFRVVMADLSAALPAGSQIPNTHPLSVDFTSPERAQAVESNEAMQLRADFSLDLWSMGICFWMIVNGSASTLSFGKLTYGEIAKWKSFPFDQSISPPALRTVLFGDDTGNSIGLLKIDPAQRGSV